MSKKIFHVVHRPKLTRHMVNLKQLLPRFKQFVHDYNLPIIMTFIFVLLVVGASVLRLSQKSSLADLLVQATTTGSDYGTLLSKDKVDEFKKNNDTNQPAVKSPTNAQTSFAISTTSVSGASGGGSSATGTGTGSTPASPFTTSIASFQQDSVALECTNPKPKPQTCSKRYTFKAGVRSQNGPGTVNYSWRSSLASVQENGTISVGGGQVISNLQKVITIQCTNPTSFNLQIVTTSPTASQSSVINVNHNCNEI